MNNLDSCHCWIEFCISSAYHEPPYTEPYVRWCGRTGVARPPPTRYGGARGGGKTDFILGDYLGYQQLYGGKVRGILFRRSYKEFDEIVNRSREIYLQAGAFFNKSEYTWYFSNGSTLRFRHIANIDDAFLYQGHQYPWMAFDEVGQWPSPAAIDMLIGCLRSPHGIPIRCLFTGNPGGPGHTWVKARFINRSTPMNPFDLLDEDGRPIPGPDGTPLRGVFIPSRLQDNPALLKNDPGYAARLHLVGSPDLVRAWLEGDWDIVAGGMFSDVWSRRVHVVRPFDISPGWRLNRSFDWGAAKPFSVGWWAESDGSSLPNQTVYPRGTLIRIAEWYGWNGIPNKGLGIIPKEIARGIREREANFPWGARVRPGPADPSIFDSAGRTSSIASEMEAEGVHFTAGNNSSRIARWQKMRTMMKNALQSPMESAGLLVFEDCGNGFIRTIPDAPRDKKNLDDLDTDYEDHVADEAGYRVMDAAHTITSIQMS